MPEPGGETNKKRRRECWLPAGFGKHAEQVALATARFICCSVRQDWRPMGRTLSGGSVNCSDIAYYPQRPWAVNSRNDKLIPHIWRNLRESGNLVCPGVAMRPITDYITSMTNTQPTHGDETMNAAQLTGMRTVAKTCLNAQTKTARQMAEIHHTLSRDGMTATTAGMVYKWDNRFSQWTPWQARMNTTLGQ